MKMIFNMLKTMWFSLIFLLYYANCKPVERLPNSLPDEVYQKLRGILMDNKELKVKNDYDPVVKKLYRLISSKKYKIKKMENPLTGNEEDLIEPFKCTVVKENEICQAILKIKIRRKTFLTKVWINLRNVKKIIPTDSSFWNNLNTTVADLSKMFGKKNTSIPLDERGLNKSLIMVTMKSKQSETAGTETFNITFKVIKKTRGKKRSLVNSNRKLIPMDNVPSVINGGAKPTKPLDNRSVKYIGKDEARINDEPSDRTPIYIGKDNAHINDEPSKKMQSHTSTDLILMSVQESKENTKKNVKRETFSGNVWNKKVLNAVHKSLKKIMQFLRSQ